MSDITIYHNPRCGTSRNTLAMIRNTGAEPNVIEYLKNPPTRETLVALIAAAGLGVRGIVRAKEAVFTELGLDDPAKTDEELIDTLIAISVVSNRLARNLSILAAQSKSTEGGKFDEQNERDVRDYRRTAQVCCFYQRRG